MDKRARQRQLESLRCHLPADELGAHAVVGDRFAPPNGIAILRSVMLRCIVFHRQSRELATRRDRHNALLCRRRGGLSFELMPAFFPPAASRRLEFDDRVHGHFRSHTCLDRCIAEVRHQALQNTHVAHNHDGYNLLLDVNHNRSQTTDQVVIALSAGESLIISRYSYIVSMV